MKIKVDGRVIVLPDESIQQYIKSMLPGWLAGTQSPQGQQNVIKAALKGVIPLMLGMLHKDVRGKGADMPAPDLKCPAARANTIIYALDYIMGNALRAANSTTFEAVGHVSETGEFIIDGVAAPRADVLSSGASRNSADLAELAA